MKVRNVQLVKSTGKPVKVADCVVGRGFWKVAHGSLPDIDSDFDADRREEVKAYLERRYNKNGMQRVFSAGMFITEKIKSGIKDVMRVHRVPQQVANYLTAMLDDKMSWTDFMKKAASDERVRDYVEKYPEVFEDMLPIMGQARTSSIHPSAIIITPEVVKSEKVNCYDLLPIKKINDILVSELSGNDIDAIGILKNDVLGIKELTRLSDMIEMIESQYHVRYTILEIASKYLNDPKVFDLVKEGYTQGLFQMNGDGMTKFIRRLKPDSINDLIAAVALFRPGPLESGAAENYVRAKRGEYEPQYLWGTYEILKDTWGQLIYQESVSQVAQKVGNLSLGDGVNLVKAISKKKIEKVRKFKDKYFEGAKKNGCPKEAAKMIWDNVESSASYLFNRSHAVAYGLTAYVGAWIKAHYTTAFYTVVLRDQDEDKMGILMNEIESVGGTELVHPDVNISGENFMPDFDNNKIYWSLSRIKQLGPKAVKYIVEERKLYGNFYDLEDFIKRIFKSKFKSFDDDGTEQQRQRCPVTARVVRNLIYAGAFDTIEHIESIDDRYQLLARAAKMLGFALTDDEVPSDMRDKHYFWSRKQIQLSGHGAVDYKKIYDDAEKPNAASNWRYIHLKELSNRFCDIKKGVICATICSVVDRSYKDKMTGENKHFGKMELQQNTDVNVLTIWDDWASYKKYLKEGVGHIIIAVVNVKWSDFDDKNVCQINTVSFLKII